MATLLLAHSMTIAAYMVHECAHNLRFLTWIRGASYGTYEDMRYKHFRHRAEPEGRGVLDTARRGEVYGGNAASFLTPF